MALAAAPRAFPVGANLSASVAFSLSRITPAGMVPDRVQASGKAVFAPGPPGSYFYRKASPECHFWHAWDQVLVRPAILGHFNNARLSVITQIGVTQLIDQKGRPNFKKHSDHLPIAFEI